MLIRTEYFPEASSLYHLPLQYVAERFLKCESLSILKLIWKGEDIGSLTLRVIPGKRPLLKSSAQLVVPILNQRPSLYAEMNCRLKSNRDIEHLQLQGSFREIAYEMWVNTLDHKMVLEVHGDGVNEKREFVLDDFMENSGKNFLRQIPGVPEKLSPPFQEMVAGVMRNIQFNAFTARIQRLGDWMEVYLVEARLDVNSWIKLWISPTGELLKLESSFGFQAMNEDFFQGVPSG